MAKEEKRNEHYVSCISRRALPHEPLLAQTGVDTAEIGPSKVRQGGRVETGFATFPELITPSREGARGLPSLVRDETPELIQIHGRAVPESKEANLNEETQSPNRTYAKQAITKMYKPDGYWDNVLNLRRILNPSFFA